MSYKDNSDDLNERRKALDINRRIEDKWRDDMTAMAYMQSTKFGSGIDVSRSTITVDPKIVEPTPPAQERSPLADLPGPIMVQMSQEVADIDSPVIEPSTITTEDFAPPPREPQLVQAMQFPEISTQGDVEVAGPVEPEVPRPAPPAPFIAEPELAIQQPVDTGPEEIPAPKLLPTFSMDVLPPPDMPEPDTSPEPEPAKTMEMPKSLGFLGMPDLKQPESAFNWNFNTEQPMENAAEEHSIQALDYYAAAHKRFVEQLVDTLFIMADKLEEAVNRIRDLESVDDRRYLRSYRQ